MRGYWLYFWGMAQGGLRILYSETEFIIVVVVEPFLGNSSINTFLRQRIRMQQ
jgi:hypothetical protein